VFRWLHAINPAGWMMKRISKKEKLNFIPTVWLMSEKEAAFKGKFEAFWVLRDKNVVILCIIWKKKYYIIRLVKLMKPPYMTNAKHWTKTSPAHKQVHLKFPEEIKVSRTKCKTGRKLAIPSRWGSIGALNYIQQRAASK